jgi:hypothetical protein
MSDSTQPNAIIKIKKQIQDIVSKLMGTTTPTNDLTEEETKLIETIGKYKVANQEELTKLSKAFGDVLKLPQTTNTSS